MRALISGSQITLPGSRVLNADLALLRSAVLADPCNFIAGAAVLALEPDRLSHALDSRRHYQARAGG